jgi:Na+/phosphate symporter
VNASSFYINILGYLQDMTQSLEFVVKTTNKHINNNHKKLKSSQIKELRQVEDALDNFFSKTQKAFNSRSFDEIAEILNDKELFVLLNEKIQAQVERTRTEESSPKNTTLYFGVLLETKDLLKATMSLLNEYYAANQSSSEVLE